MEDFMRKFQNNVRTTSILEHERAAIVFNPSQLSGLVIRGFTKVDPNLGLKVPAGAYFEVKGKGKNKTLTLKESYVANLDELVLDIKDEQAGRLNHKGVPTKAVSLLVEMAEEVSGSVLAVAVPTEEQVKNLYSVEEFEDFVKETGRKEFEEVLQWLRQTVVSGDEYRAFYSSIDKQREEQEAVGRDLDEVLEERRTAYAAKLR